MNKCITDPGLSEPTNIGTNMAKLSWVLNHEIHTTNEKQQKQFDQNYDKDEKTTILKEKSNTIVN